MIQGLVCPRLSFSDPPAFIQVLRLQTCATIPGLCGARDRIQNLMNTRQALSQLSYIPSSPSISSEEHSTTP